MHLGAVLESLLDAEVDELLAEDLRMSRHVVDVLLGIRRGDLAAELLEALDDAHGPVAVARVVGGSQAGRARAENRDVDDALGAHRERMLTTRVRAISRSRSRSLRRPEALALGALFHLEGVAAAARRR